MKVSAKNMIVYAQRLKTHRNQAIIVVSLNHKVLLGDITRDVVGLTDKTIFSTVISRPRTTFMIFTQTLHRARQKLATAVDSDSTRKEVERSKIFTGHLKVRKMQEIRDKKGI